METADRLDSRIHEAAFGTEAKQLEPVSEKKYQSQKSSSVALHPFFPRGNVPLPPRQPPPDLTFAELRTLV